MFRHFIAIKTFEHQMDCFCSDGTHAEVLTIHKEDIIEIINERKFMIEKGWYFLIRMNNQYNFHIALEDLERYYLNERLLSLIDIELALNYLQFKVDQALDTGDEELFLNFTKKLKESRDLKMKLEQCVHNVAV
ncbi:IDEAL domain-containing protein [Bacillus sp. V3B]|uniref:IDEAL domain-containing protein n=1 Tax=Bacillus sp. V3B TaxID=2804915 RepID=UPI00210983CA|nr:IDEAL domain-containing protein [Bacillus sp. V3B]MCQ6276243.1 IDEAL domain-containing protein [Bacillus sp. V3B]